VKVDVQGTVGLMGSKLGGGPDMTRKYHQSLERSVQAAFPGNHCINCMCHSTENLYRCDLFLSIASTAILFRESKPRLGWSLHNDSAWLTCISIPYAIVADCIFSAGKACNSMLAQATLVQLSISFGVPCFWAGCQVREVLTSLVLIQDGEHCCSTCIR